MRSQMLSVILLAALGVAPGAAQEALSRSPHGDLPSRFACTNCHTVEGWQPLMRGFSHDTATAFPLSGRHRDLTCTLCHLNKRFDEPKAAPTDCGVCHFDVHRGELSDNCVQCHNTERFNDIRGLAVHQRTRFPLTGAHVQVTCDACHPGDERGVFVTRDVACFSCHAAEYAAAQPIDHAATGFPTTCEQCHTTLAWSHAVRFDHVAASGGFDLLGRHAEIRCVSCHDPSTLAPIFPTNDPNDCVTCHQQDYDREHGGAFPTTCGDCHTVFGWEGATFDHVQVTGYPLVEVHETLACDQCHVVPGMDLLFQPAGPDDCFTCHSADYQSEHAGSGFPTTCLSCHDQRQWEGASFTNHDAQFFPIYSGAHRDKWPTCQTCHNVPNDFGTFTCLVCHEHSQTLMDEKHRERSGYTYDSARCYSCHPSGRGD